MALYSVPDVASVGIVYDTSSDLLPPGAWSSGQNVRFVDGSAKKFEGHSSIATPSVAPYGVVPVIKSTTPYWVYPGLKKVYSWDGTNHVNITRQTTGADVDYTGDASDIWNGGLVQGMLVLNNGKDPPQMWTGTLLSALTWDGSNTWAAKGYKAKVIRPYKSFLVALDWNDGSTDYHQAVYWSNQADANAVPTDWDYADPANEAGIYELAATQGYCVDGQELRDSFVVYKQDSTHLMSYVGGGSVMSFRDVSKTTGALAQRCVQEFYGKHLVVGRDDVFVHDGQNIESIASKRVRAKLFGDIDTTYYGRAFTALNLAKEELWICYPETGSATANKAAVWNWRANTWGWRDLPSLTAMGRGVTPSTIGTTTWAADSDAWDADSTIWDGNLYAPAETQLVGTAAANLFLMDDTNKFAGASITSFLQRTGIQLDTQSTVKRVTAVYPRATGGAMSVYVGAKFDAADSYKWEGPYTFTPGTDSKVSVRVTGRTHAVKFVFPTGAAGALQGYDLAFEVVGKR